MHIKSTKEDTASKATKIQPNLKHCDEVEKTRFKQMEVFRLNEEGLYVGKYTYITSKIFKK